MILEIRHRDLEVDIDDIDIRERISFFTGEFQGFVAAGCPDVMRLRLRPFEMSLIMD